MIIKDPKIDALTACFELAITVAVEEEKAGTWGSDRQISAHMRAFEMAASFGWDWQKDEDFQDWSLKATSNEILAYGRKRAVKFIQSGAEPAQVVSCECGDPYCPNDTAAEESPKNTC